MNTADFLECKDKSLLIIEKRTVEEVVIAVPHHAPLGIRTLPCPEHKDADENAGLLGLYIAQLLDCCCIIACNYFIDSNKYEDSDYFKKLLSWKPIFLIEIHGHGGRRARYDIEISSGNAERDMYSHKMSSILEGKMKKIRTLESYTISGKYNEIAFKASKSKTIVSDKWLPFHIELPKSLRSQSTHYLPFCELLADTVREMLEEHKRNL